VAGGWQISGITRFQSGAPLSLTTSLKTGCSSSAVCAATTANNFGTDITGGGDAWRAVMSCKSGAVAGRPDARPLVQRGRLQSAGAGPAGHHDGGVLAVLQRGNTPKTFARSPGINNTDLALFKNISLTEHLKGATAL